jgi:hypothetical protein
MLEEGVPEGQISHNATFNGWPSAESAPRPSRGFETTEYRLPEKLLVSMEGAALSGMTYLMFLTSMATLAISLLLPHRADRKIPHP